MKLKTDNSLEKSLSITIYQRQQESGTQPVSCHWSLSIPYEIKNSDVPVFPGYGKRPVR